MPTAKTLKTKPEAAVKTKKIRSLDGKVLKLVDPTTIKVRVERKQRHPKYGKVVASHRNYLVHVESAELRAELVVGQIVQISETRPISKMKHWKLLSKV